MTILNLAKRNLMSSLRLNRRQNICSKVASSSWVQYSWPSAETWDCTWTAFPCAALLPSRSQWPPAERRWCGEANLGAEFRAESSELKRMLINWIPPAATLVSDICWRFLIKCLSRMTCSACRWIVRCWIIFATILRITLRLPSKSYAIVL